jgi:magnesium chelatase family protein
VEIQRYWRRVGGALLDRIDVRVPLAPVPGSQMFAPVQPGKSAEARRRVANAVDRQRLRYEGLPFSWNSRIPAGLIDRFCPMDADCRGALRNAAETLGLSSRAFHSVLRMALTIADLEGSERVKVDHVLEAVQHRRFGDGDFYWSRTGRSAK